MFIHFKQQKLLIALSPVTSATRFFAARANRKRHWLRMETNDQGQEGPGSAVLKHKEGEDRFSLSFVIKSQELNLEKQFNLSRPITETGTQFLGRINANVDKVLKKTAKKRKADDSAASACQAKFLQSDGSQFPLDDLVGVCDVLFTSGLQLDVLGQRFLIDRNPPTVERLELPDQVMAGFVTYPRKMVLQFADRESTRFQWHTSQQQFGEEEAKTVDEAKVTWVERSDGFFFEPNSDDIGRLVKVVCHPRSDSQNREGAAYSVIGKSAVSAGPGPCPFENRQAFTQEPVSPKELRVVTYNLLADLYAQSEVSRNQLYPYCPPYALDIEYRRLLLLKELRGYNSDILCLQEVDQKVFDLDLSPVLGDVFEGDFAKKGGQVSEGCACMWRKDKLEMVQSKRLVLSERLKEAEHLKDLCDKIEGNEAASESLAQRTTVLQLVILRHKSDPDKVLIVGNTHLYFKPDADHIRLLQMGVIMAELGRAADGYKRDNPEAKCSLILCGDMNSTPPFGVLEYLLNGRIGADHADWRSCPGEEVEGVELSHSRSFDSACGTPQYTNYTGGFKDCLDYVFFDKSGFRVNQVVPFPSEEELSVNLALPSIVFPSDHIACIADLTLL